MTVRPKKPFAPVTIEIEREQALYSIIAEMEALSCCHIGASKDIDETEKLV